MVRGALLGAALVVAACGGIAVIDPASDGGGDGGSGAGMVSSSTGTMSCTLTGNESCTTCVGQACSGQLLSCCEEPLCIEVVQCALDSGCMGFDCLGPCGDVIEQAGGTMSPAVVQAIAVRNCASQSCGC